MPFEEITNLKKKESEFQATFRNGQIRLTRDEKLGKLSQLANDSKVSIFFNKDAHELSIMPNDRAQYQIKDNSKHRYINAAPLKGIIEDGSKLVLTGYNEQYGYVFTVYTEPQF